jgi:hypothetical protein
MVFKLVILATWEEEIKRITVQGQSVKKVWETLGMVTQAVILAMWDA